MFVSALVNVALHKPVTQTTIRDFLGPTLVVDGNKNPNAEKGGSCSATDLSKYPWWRVDLGSTFQLKEVSITQGNSKGKLRYVFITYVLIPVYKLETSLVPCQMLPPKQYAGVYITTSVIAFIGTLPKKARVHL